MSRENAPLISVIVTVYNLANYLTKCLESIINQTYKNLEIICINDGSTDNSLDLLMELEKKDSRILVINQKNHGVSYARNVGINESHGQYISFIDGDDWIDFNYYEVLIDNIMINQSDFIMNGIKFIRGTKSSKNHTKNFTTDSLYKKINQFRTGSICDKLFKSTLIKNNNLRFIENHRFEDNIFLIQAAYYSNKVSFTNKVSYNYFMNNNSFSNNQDIEKIELKRKDQYFAFNYLFNFAKEFSFTPKEFFSLKKFCLNAFCSELLNRKLFSNVNQIKQMLGKTFLVQYFIISLFQLRNYKKWILKFFNK